MKLQFKLNPHGATFQKRAFVYSMDALSHKLVASLLVPIQISVEMAGLD
jgi:hypothetical protein